MQMKGSYVICKCWIFVPRCIETQSSIDSQSIAIVARALLVDTFSLAGRPKRSFRATVRGSIRQVGGTEVILLSYIKHEERHYVALPLFDLSASLSRRYFAVPAPRPSTKVHSLSSRRGANEHTLPS